MKTLNTYSVSFTGLPNGVHSFTYQVDSSFFQQREYSPIETGDIEVHLEFDKRDRFFVMNFHYAGIIGIKCDRCLSDVTIPVNSATSLLVKMLTGDAENIDLTDDEVMYIQPTDNKIEFAQFLYENIIVNIPLYKTCEDDISGEKKCDPEIVSILEKENDGVSEGSDPRWEKLKDLKNK